MSKEKNTPSPEAIQALLGDNLQRRWWQSPTVWMGVASVVLAAGGYAWWSAKAAANAKPLYVTEVVKRYQPDQATVEIVFVNVNPQSTLLLGQARGAALTAQNSAQERQYGALQKRPGHGSGQRGVCRAEVQPPRTAVRQLPHGGAERVQLGVQLQCAGRRGRGQGLRRQHQPQ